MAATLNDFFAAPVLTELANSEQVKRGLPVYFDSAFAKPSMAKPVNSEVKYKAYKGTRESAQLVQAGGPSVNVEVPGSEFKIVTAVGSAESFLTQGDRLQAIFSDIPYIRQQAMAEYKKNIADFRSRAETLKTNLIASALFKGKIYQKNNQLTLPTTSGASAVIDFSPTTLAQGANTNIGGMGTSLTVPDFAASTTDIPGFFRSLKQVFAFTSNYEATTIHYGKNIPGYLGVSNTAMQAYWSRNQVLGAQYMSTAEVPNGFADFNWKPAYRQYFIDPSNSNAPTSWIGDDQIVVTAPVDDSWYEMFETGIIVPRGVPTISSTVDEVVNGNFDINWGLVAYAHAIMDPVAVKTIVKWSGMPVIKNPLAHWIITVH